MPELPAAAAVALATAQVVPLAEYVARASDPELEAVKAALGETWMYDTDSPDWLLLRLTLAERAERARVALAPRYPGPSFTFDTAAARAA